MKLRKKLYLGISCLAIGALLYACLRLSYYGDDWKQRTTPLPDETVAILCTNFDLERDHPLCNGKKNVYGPDFYEIIRDTFRPYEAYKIASSEAATYEDVEEKIGAFMYECEPVVTTGDGFTFFSCNYDLRGDREFIIGIMFTYPDNAVFRINTPMGFDGE